MNTIDVIIETPRGSAEKYAYDWESGFFRLKKLLPKGMVFPYDFGFVPDTRADDGDPLDVMVISDLKISTGAIISCRILGVLQIEQTQKGGGDKMIRNDRYIAVPAIPGLVNDIEEMTQLPAGELEALEQFFVQYLLAEGKQARLIGKLGAAEAMAVINESKV